MNTTTQPPRTAVEIRREGFQALLDRLGPADALRFLLQYEPGSGDYTRDRHQWLDAISMEEALQRIRGREPSEQKRGL